MKLHLTPDELTAGHRTSKLSPKRLAKLIDEKANCPLFLLSAHHHFESGRVVAVLVTDLEGVAEGQTKMTFEPVSAKAFVVYDAKTKELISATLQMPHGQYTFTHDDSKRTSLALEGPGVDPDVVSKSWDALGQIFNDSKGNSAICRRIVKHLQEALVQSKQKVA